MQLIDQRPEWFTKPFIACYSCMHPDSVRLYKDRYNAPVKAGLTTLSRSLHPVSAHLYKDTILTHAAIIEDSRAQ